LLKSIDLIKPYFREKRLIIACGITCLIVVDFLQLFIPRIIKWAVDDLTALRLDLKNLLYYSLYIIAVGIMIGLFRYLWRRCLIGTSRLVEEGLRNRLMGHVQTLSASYFSQAKTGDIMAHATNDIQHIRMATGMGLVALTDAVVLSAAAIGFMVYINIWLTFFVIIPMPLIIFGTRFFSRRMHRLYQEVQSRFADLTEVVRESFTGIRILKAYNRQAVALETLDSTSRDYIVSNIRLVRITGAFFPMMLLFSNLSLAIVLYLGGRLTITSTITPGDFVAFISYLGLLTWPMMAMGWVANLIQRGKASLDRINKILITRPEIEDHPEALPLVRPRGSVVFDKVAFAYCPGGPSVLSEIDFELKPGRILGVVGPPGSGKTTLLNLIPRLYDVQGGRILFDGIDIRRLRIRDLRSQISFMPQEPFLFADTIRKNITLGDDEKNSGDLMQAAERAALLDTIQSFPDGFDTLVGEKGIILSGGQKQRIALARAFLQEPALLILDDPISQVDAETGAAIIESIRSRTGRQSVIIVSHRLSALRFADSIISLIDGRISETGTHEALVDKGGYYAGTFQLQKIEEDFNAY